MPDQKLTFSVIVPSRNEGDDIRLALESALQQSYPAQEIIVIDDSTDQTPAIVKEYADRGVSLIDGPRQGCCGARNLGLKRATGDVVILLNADVVLPADFLKCLRPHYEHGADYVLVESEVMNQDSPWARFIEMQHRWEYRGRDDIEWTEGFSCRRAAALSIGGIPGEFSLTFCRDWLLGRNLARAGFKKVIDRSILVRHKAPPTFNEYWQGRKARGRFGALGQHFLWQRSLPYLAGKFLIKDLRTFLFFVTVMPVVWRVARISAHSPQPARDFLPFLVTFTLQEIARSLGEWQGLMIAWITNRADRHS